VLGSLTPADLDTHVKLLLSEGLEVEMLVHGNMDKADAVAVAAMVAGNFTPLPAAQIPSQRVVQLAPRHQYLLQAREYNDKDQNSAAYLSFQFGEDTLETRSRAEFLAHLLKEPCFNQLRTVEQLGYLVFSGLQAQRGVLSLRVLLQSSERPAHYLHQRAEAFLEHTFRAVLSNLDDESFERERNSVLADIEEKDKTLNQETNRYWSEVVLRRYTFDRREQKAAAVRAVTKAELLVFFETHVAVNSERRLLSLQYFGAGHAMPGEEGFVVTPSESEAKLPKAATDGAEGEATSSAEATSDEPKADLSAPPVDNAKVCKIEDLEFSKFRLSMPLYPDFC
jgi:insulysin